METLRKDSIPQIYSHECRPDGAYEAEGCDAGEAAVERGQADAYDDDVEQVPGHGQTVDLGAVDAVQQSYVGKITQRK